MPNIDMADRLRHLRTSCGFNKINSTRVTWSRRTSDRLGSIFALLIHRYTILRATVRMLRSDWVGIRCRCQHLLRGERYKNPQGRVRL